MWSRDGDMTFDPTITGLNTTLSANTVEVGAGIQLDDSVIVANLDGTRFGGGSLVVSVAGATADDNLQVVPGGFITVSGNQVFRAGVLFGEIVSDGSSGSDLVINFLGSQASETLVNDLIESIHYQSTSPAAGSKTINYALTDAELETVNQSLALTITGTQAPTITGLATTLSANTVEVGAGIQLDDSVIVANLDGTRFGGGSLVVSVAGATADDNLQVVPGGFITVSGNQVFRAGVLFGEIVSDGSSGSDLVINFLGSQASETLVNDLIESIHYQSTSPAAGSKTINYALTDAELETVNQSLALTITGTQAPTITGLATTLSANTVEVGAGIQLDDSVIVANLDGTRFGGGSLVVSVAGATADDNLQVVPGGFITVSGNQVFRAGVLFGEIVSDGSSGSDLVINFLGSQASETLVNDLIEAIHYQSTSPAAGSKTINYALTDAELETVNQSLALTITGTQAPTITGLATTLSANTVEVGAGIQLDDSVIVANLDGTRFGGGSLVVSVAGATADDNLQVVPGGFITVSGNQVFRAGVLFGEIVSDGSSGSDLVINFLGSQASETLVNDLIESIHYQSTSPAAGSKTINYALTDAELETVNQSLALTITGTQAPTITGLATTLSANTVEVGAGIQLDDSVIVANLDGTRFGGGSLVVSVAGATADDNLQVVPGGFITVSGNQVFRAGVLFGEIVSDGSSGSDLVINFLGSQASETLVNDLIESIHYQSTSPAAGSKTINYALTDAELETVNQSLALTITGTQAPTITGLATTLSANTVEVGAGIQLDDSVC
jgi:hypothetical protein